MTVARHEEPCVEVSGDLRDMLLAIVAWVARMESARRSERVPLALLVGWPRAYPSASARR